MREAGNTTTADNSRARSEGTFFFLSELQGMPILSASGEKLGRLVDLIVDDSEPAYPPVRAIGVRAGSRETRRVSWSEVEELGAGFIRLRRGREALGPMERQPNEFSLVEDVLDRQLVDTDGAKVRRANDVHLLLARGGLRVAHVDVGVRGLIRRIGWQGPMDAVVRMFKPNAYYLRDEKFVRWKNVQPLTPSAPRLRLDVARAALSRVHPADLAEILTDLDRPEREVLFKQLPVEAAADTLEEVDSPLQRELLRSVQADRAADLLEAMEPDEAADLLGDLPAAESAQLLAAMEPPEAKEIRQLLKYPEDAAGGMMTPDFVKVSGDGTVGQAFENIRTQAHAVKHIHDVFVTDEEGKLRGFVPLRDLLLAGPMQPLRPLVQEHPAPLLPEDSAKRAAELAAKYKLLSLPVQTPEGKLLGVVTIDDVLERAMQ
jgi:CBS domain-containing protein